MDPKRSDSRTKKRVQRTRKHEQPGVSDTHTASSSHVSTHSKQRSKLQVNRDAPASSSVVSGSSAIPQTGGTTSDSESQNRVVQRTLEALGAPRISEGDFDRLCQGSLGDSLRFLGERVKGRQGAIRQREVIARYLESKRMKGKGAGSVGWSYDRFMDASSQLRTAQQELESLRKEADGLQELIFELETQNDELRQKEEDKRLTNLLYSVLEKKEDIRVKRIARLGQELQNLQGRNSNSIPPILPPIPQEDPSLQQSSLSRPDHTRDMIASLQSLHVHLSQLISNPPQESSSSLEARLLKSIAKSMDLPNDDKRVVEKHQQCINAARKQALMAISPPFVQNTNEGGTEKILNAIIQRVAEKEEVLQHTSDHVTALSAVCAQLLQEISTFNESTVPVLKESLVEDRDATQGYLDDLRLLVDSRRQGSLSPPVIGGPNGATINQTLSQVESSIREVHEKTSFLNAARIASPEENLQTQSLVEKYINEDARKVAQHVKLLEHKLDKSKIGDVLIAKLGRLAKDIDAIAGLV